MANNKELQDEILYRSKLDASPDTHRPHVKFLLNSAILFFRNLIPLKINSIRRSFDTVDSQEEYRLPYDIVEIGSLWHEDFGYVFKMQPITAWEFNEANLADRDTEGTPEFYYLFGVDSSLAQPSAASTITAVSSSTADTTQKVRVEGEVSSYQDSEELSLNGTTTQTTTKLFTRIDRVTMWDDSATQTENAGRITVASGATTITVLPVNFYDKAPDYWRVRLYPIPPDDGVTINVDGYDRLHRMVKDGDANPLGDEFDEAIILWVASKMINDDLELRAQLKNELATEITVLKTKNNRNLDRVYRLRSRDTARIDNKRDVFLRFGANFPIVPK